jgi:hypothetical protein
MVFTFANSSDIFIPLNDSNSAGICAAISVMSPVILHPDVGPLPVDTIVILSMFASGTKTLSMISGKLVISLSTTSLVPFPYATASFIALAFAFFVMIRFRLRPVRESRTPYLPLQRCAATSRAAIVSIRARSTSAGKPLRSVPRGQDFSFLHFDFVFFSTCGL